MPSRPTSELRLKVPLVGCLLVAVLSLEGCSGAPAPILAPLVQSPSKTPVIYVPGSTGTELRDRETQKIVWGRGRQLIVPRDGAYSMARPIHYGPSSDETRFEVTRAIEKITVAGVFSQDVYGPIIELLQANGYQRGDLNAPEAGDSAFLFAYDWRLDHRLAAQRLHEQLEALRVARGEERLEVDLICQSNGGYVCRYLLKYGGASLEDAEAGRAAPPPAIDVRKVVLLGNSNGGSLRMLREIHRGRRYVQLVGRRMRPEVLFSVPAFFQDLPVLRQDLFLDSAGQPLAIDIFDADAWQKYGWSVFAPEARARLAKADRQDLFGTETERLQYLEAVLAYSQRFHALLRRDVEGFGDTRYYMLQSRALDTPDRAVLVEENGGWTTLFSGDKRLVQMGEVHQLATAEGDGHGTVDSQLWLSPQERAALVGEPFYVDADHFELILQPETHRRMLEVLYDGAAASNEE
ncbi:MAG: hypothetical protein AAF657_21405 [Acidobacteriota bacterium]